MRSPHRVQAPTRGDARHLPRRVLPVAARADQQGVGAAIDLVERAVVAAVKKVLELPADRRQVLGRGKHIAIGRQHIGHPGLCSVQQAHGHGGLGGLGGGTGGLGHLAGAAGGRVVDDEQGLDGA